ncbi:alpha/beta fold hydrolase [Rhizobium sp. S153]|uniref:Alpha/beta fold hydrolase n=1 Tax=Ciceribacter sichuanensis TaxID=2949647 RepID=A0ABT0VCC3_9HYPH|nr:alpha/beta fold hydrolase [Ciceribacter sp. S153]
MALHAVITGDPHATIPLVLLHGFGGGAFVWREVTDRLPANLPVIAYDLPGHAGSLHAEGLGGAGRMAKAIVSDLDRRGIPAFHLAGHSLGGAAAALIALRRPEAALSLTMVAPGGFGPEINHRVLKRFGLVETAEELRSALEIMVGYNFDIPETMIEATLEARRGEGAREALSTVFAAIVSANCETGPAQGQLPLADIFALPMPKALLWGLEDCILPPHQSVVSGNGLAVRRLPGAGHMLVDECPDIVAEEILRTIRRVEATVS